MLNQKNILFIEQHLKYSIKETFLLEEKILLYDALIFCSLISKTKTFCSKKDLEAFKQLSLFCKTANISLASYIGCAYNYISKYVSPGHRLSLSYFLNPSVIEFCGTKIDVANIDSLLIEQIKSDLLTTEKEIRNTMSEYISYNKAFEILLKKKKISNYFLAYKKFCGSEVIKYSSEYFDSLVEILEPFFTYILAKNQIYTPYKIKSWNNSKIEDYSFCPVYFTQRYITNELGEDCLGNLSTNQGTMAHSIFETIIKKYTINKKKDLLAIATRYFNSNTFLTIEKEIFEHVPYIKSLFLDPASFIHSIIIPEAEILVEHTMNGVLENQAYYGTADLIVINKNVAHIIDYKTSKLDPKYLDKNNKKYTKQLSLYAKLLCKERPEITTVLGTLIYTRGLIKSLELNSCIITERNREIENIKKLLKSGILEPKTTSCFLCRSSICRFRLRDSIWDSDGNRKQPN